MKRLNLISLVALSAVTVACSPVAFDPSFTETATPQNAQLEKQISVDKLTPTVIVEFAPGRAGMSDLSKGKILGFLEAQGIGFGDDVEVELPTFVGNGGLNEQRFGEVSEFLQDRGFKVLPVITKENSRNTLRVYFTKYVATVDPDCENGWYRPKGLGYENLPLPNMGCTTANALAGMIENPKDLVDPNDSSPTIGERAAKSVQKYRGGAAGGGSSSSESN
ncbi:CpaD family pilus assembly lipoprotein [Sneathiella marina]|uniref:CpaD family pilus assembly lipoprotein n=1 Tax=Sneathiella marina TaxID=2950108 RepID=A0ABY4WCH2_9PROT|nr:CpaD family pilus assembly lipoprotein [Sneathiella marina]USG62944.1 CpaD family pilus assembly lipoprotein [Sneathiella marina]